MNFKRMGRCLVCLLLVCALMVNISPVKAKAAEVIIPTILGPVAVDAGMAALACALGFGLGVGANVDDWEAVGNDIVDAWKESGVIGENGGLALYELSDGRFGIEAGLLQDTFDWIWDNGVLTDSAAVSNSYTICNDLFGGNSTYVYSCDVPFAPCWFYYNYGSSQYVCELFVAMEPCTISRTRISGTTSGWSSMTLNTYLNGYYFSGSAGSRSNYDMSNAGGIYLGEVTRRTYEEWAYGSPVISSEYAYALTYWTDKLGFTSTPTTEKDLTLGEIAPAGSTIADGYPNWSANAIEGTYDETTGMIVYPIGTVGTVTDLSTYTQSDIQSGTVPFVIVIDQTETGGDSTEPTEPSNDNTGSGIVTANLLERLFGGVTDWFSKIKTAIEELPSKFADWFNTLSTQLELLPSKFKEFFDPILEWLAQLWEVVSGIPKAVADLFRTLLTSLFAPGETFIATKVNELCAKYPHLNTFFALGGDLKTFFAGLGTKAPIIYIDLGAAAGSYYLGGKEIFLDLTWYAQYKATIDNIIGGFIWLWLAWRVFLSLPGLIQGASGFWGERKTDIGSGSTMQPTIVHQRELPSGSGLRRREQ